MDLVKLHHIDEELTIEEVDALKFLCLDTLSKKRLESVKDAKDLFIRLHEQDLLNDEHFLSELLYTIGRYDLLCILDTNKQKVKQFLEIQNNACIKAYRKMLYRVSEEVTDEHLNKIKFLLYDLPKITCKNATFLDIVIEMEKKEMLGEGNLDNLRNILKKCSLKLSLMVQNQTTNQTDRPKQICIPTESIPISETCSEEFTNEIWRENMQNYNLYHNESSASQLPTLFTDANKLLNTSGSSWSPTEEAYFYSIKHRPVGYCLIINNYDFSGTTISNRKGTDMDRDALTRVFEKMHFLVEERRDLNSDGINDAINEFSNKDHSAMDAFVCCILSHGKKGSVFGVDGISVLIRNLTQPFAHCPTLRSKPKLFFIQACQGHELQKGVWMDDGIPEINPLYADDSQTSGLSSIPIEADFLIGMATVAYYKSFRHTTEGSIYIQELCQQLEIGCPRNEDILSILTKVNANVSTKVLQGHKQMPEPRYTLTKKLVLPMD